MLRNMDSRKGGYFLSYCIKRRESYKSRRGDAFVHQLDDPPTRPWRVLLSFLGLQNRNRKQSEKTITRYAGNPKAGGHITLLQSSSHIYIFSPAACTSFSHPPSTSWYSYDMTTVRIRAADWMSNLRNERLRHLGTQNLLAPITTRLWFAARNIVDGPRYNCFTDIGQWRPRHSFFGRCPICYIYWRTPADMQTYEVTRAGKRPFWAVNMYSRTCL
jgi:hypothetical protein